MKKENEILSASSFYSGGFAVYATDKHGKEYTVKFNDENPLFLIGVAAMLQEHAIGQLSNLYFAVQKVKG